MYPRQCYCKLNPRGFTSDKKQFYGNKRQNLARKPKFKGTSVTAGRDLSIPVNLCACGALWLSWNREQLCSTGWWDRGAQAVGFDPSYQNHVFSKKKTSVMK